MACILFDASHGASRDAVSKAVEGLMHTAQPADAHDIAHYTDPTSGHSLATLITDVLNYTWSWAKTGRGQPQVFRQLLKTGACLTVPDARGRLPAHSALENEGWLMGNAFRAGVNPLAVEPATGRSFLSPDFAPDGPAEPGADVYRYIRRTLKALDHPARNLAIEAISPSVAPVHQAWWSDECARYIKSQVDTPRVPKRLSSRRL
jgi:hypothetical protein